MNDPDDYEYSGRQSKFPPVLQLLGYFGFGIGMVWLAFDRLAELTRFEEVSVTSRFQPLIRVHWLEKFLYELGGKHLIFGVSLVFGMFLIGFGIWRLISWFRLRNSL